MKANKSLSSNSISQLADSHEVGLSKYKLTLMPSLDTKIESFLIDIEYLKQLPAFSEIDKFMEEFFKRNDVTNPQISYAIWGGVAANLLLNLIGKTNTYYSFHDIELFLSRERRIYLPDDLINILRNDFSSSRHFLLDLGGIPIIKGFEGMSVKDFQKQRIYRKDGDLFLNNVILSVDREARNVIIYAPSGTIQGLICGENTIKMKNTSDLQDINRIARRIYRNISKSVRFQQVSQLSVDEKTKRSLECLIKSYSNKLDDYFHGSLLSSEEEKVIKEWIASKNLDSADSGKRWLYIMTLSDTAKRLAGLNGVSSLDFSGFSKFLLGDTPGATSLFDNPLIQLIRNDWSDPTWPNESALRLDIIQKCYLDFFQYQKPTAEKLFAFYSLKNF